LGEGGWAVQAEDAHYVDEGPEAGLFSHPLQWAVAPTATDHLEKGVLHFYAHVDNV